MFSRNPNSPVVPVPPLPQDLHIHTVFSHEDSAVAPEQTLGLIKEVAHGEVLGISDHLECLDAAKTLDTYCCLVKNHGFRLGIEVDGAKWVNLALAVPVEYYVYHCHDEDDSYRGADRLLETGRPLIIAHPQHLGTNLSMLPRECCIEINNRYVWRHDYRKNLTPYLDRFSFVINSDAHQPNWLNQTIARRVAAELGVLETRLFSPLEEREGPSHEQKHPVENC